MKETNFKFSLAIESGSSDSIIANLREKLSKIGGVESIDSQFDGYLIQLHVRVRFENSDAAEKLHRKVMKTIKTAVGVRISSVTTKVTDIF